jgi:hypothetical protein
MLQAAAGTLAKQARFMLRDSQLTLLPASKEAASGPLSLLKKTAP